MFGNKMKDVLRLRTQGMNRQVIMDCVSIIEEAVKKLYEEVLPQLNVGEKQEVVDLERKFSEKESPLRSKVGLGRWIRFYNESKLQNYLLKYQIINDAIDLAGFEQIKETRNKCEHNGYTPSTDEMEKTYRFTIDLLMKWNFIKEEPKSFVRTEGSEEPRRSEAQIVTDKIRLSLATDPFFRINEHYIYDDYGKSYDIDATYEFVGAYCEKDMIQVVLLEAQGALYHEDVMDFVYTQISDSVEERTREKIPDLRGVKLRVILVDRIEFTELFSVVYEL